MYVSRKDRKIGLNNLFQRMIIDCYNQQITNKTKYNYEFLLKIR